ncbi:MAG TPA: peptidoglycan-binding domain-containing protein, partial [Aliidongia sp.]|uniref:peptidoglycan-binding domain-containing protein n=1 Tax=Aliidongia sp. TaxID=1914230 RepID=UPI002DDCA02A
MKVLMRPSVRFGRLAIAALILLGLALLHPDSAAAQDCGGGPLSTSKGNVIGSLAGAAGGGLLGSQFGGGAGKGLMTGLGVVGGALAGGYAGRSVEGCDRPHRRPAAQGANQAARACRSVNTQAVIDGQNQPVEGVACLDPDGVWRVATGPDAERAAEGDLILRTQQRLHDQGFYVRNNIDGRWGPATSGALRNFQQANGITPNGQLDAPTRTALGLAPVPLTELTAQNAPSANAPP